MIEISKIECKWKPLMVALIKAPLIASLSSDPGTESVKQLVELLATTFSCLTRRKDIEELLEKAFSEAIEESVAESEIRIQREVLLKIIADLVVALDREDTESRYPIVGLGAGNNAIEEALKESFRKWDVHIEDYPNITKTITNSITLKMEHIFNDNERIQNFVTYCNGQYLRKILSEMIAGENDIELFRKQQNWIEADACGDLSCYQVETRDYLTEIDRKLFPDIKNMLETNFIDDNDRKETLVGRMMKYLVKIGYPDDYRYEPARILLTGTGGMGKTTAQLNLLQLLLTNKCYVLYVPLHVLSESKRIQDYLADRIYHGNHMKAVSFYEKEGTQRNMVYLLDGYNEVTSENRKEINEMIKAICSTEANVVITSRDELTPPIQRLFTEKLRLQPLDRETIRTYLAERGVPIPADDSKLWGILDTPLMLVLYAQTEKRYEEDHGYVNWKENISAGAILWNFLQCERLKLLQENQMDEEKNVKVAVNIVSPYIAWEMSRKNSFVIENGLELAEWMKECFSYCDRCKENRGGGYIIDLYDFPLEGNNLQKIQKKLLDLRILVPKDKAFEFMHQNFRDCLAAAHCLNVIEYEDKKDMDTWREKVLSDEILQYIIELDEENIVDKLWKRTGDKGDMDIESRTMFNLIAFYKKKFHSDLSELDFTGQDLTNISLNGIKLVRGKKRAKFDYARIGKVTFMPQGHTDTVTCLLETSDGKYVISGSRDGTLRKWNIETGRQEGDAWEGHIMPVTCVLETKDGKHVISGSYDGSLKKWNVNTGRQVGNTWEGHTRAVSCMLKTKDGEYVISGSGDGSIRKWNIEIGKQEGAIWEAHDGSIKCILETSDGKYVISGSSDGSIRKWEIETGKQKGDKWKSRIGGIVSLLETSDGKCVISGSYYGGISKWNINTGRKIGNTWECHTRAVSCMLKTKDGEYVISGSGDGSIRKWNIEKGKQEGNAWKENASGVTCMLETSDGEYVISGSYDGSIRKWNIEKGKQEGNEWNENANGVTCMLETSDGEYVISGSDDGSIRRWNINTGKQVGSAWECCKEWVLSILMASDGKYVISRSFNGIYRKWNINTGRQEEDEWERHTDRKTCNVVLIDGQSDENLEKWIIEMSRQEEDKRERHVDGESCKLAINDGKYMISASYDGTIRKWNTVTGKQEGDVWKGHTDCVNKMIKTEDEKYVISCSFDGSLRMWSIRRGEQIKKFYAIPNCNIYGCTFRKARFDNEDTRSLIYTNGGVLE